MSSFGNKVLINKLNNMTILGTLSKTITHKLILYILLLLYKTLNN